MDLMTSLMIMERVTEILPIDPSEICNEFSWKSIERL